MKELLEPGVLVSAGVQSQSLWSVSDSDSVLLATNLTVESKIQKKPTSSSPVLCHNEKRDRGIKNLADSKHLSVFLSLNLTERLKENKLLDSVSKLLLLSVCLSLFFLSPCPCLGLCCTVEASRGHC